ncbi:MAG TPA: pyrroline-5-carboxylate reductase [Bryobacteraceae bacterium]|jgi:pyrroline-5-carboxylate reductase|nr:pyrroline-5-carboxylate reductase [Bryobacteraceae bacterium]
MHSHERAPFVEPLVAAGRTLGVIGAGVMGQTLMQGLLESKAVARAQAWASSKTETTCENAAAKLEVPVEVDYRHRVAGAAMILICVKPAQAGKVIATLKESGIRPDALVISIMAGVTIAQLEVMLASANPLIRAMPNTPCIVREGMTVICPGTKASTANMAAAQRVFEAVGQCLATEEGYFDAITALSGSGPAYQYLIMESFADAGVRVGLPRHMALKLVAQTAVGAARMVQASGRHPAALRDDVTTPAGCTIGGLLMLEDGKIRSVLARAIEEATKIAAGLGAAAQKKDKQHA